MMATTTLACKHNGTIKYGAVATVRSSSFLTEMDAWKVECALDLGLLAGSLCVLQSWNPAGGNHDGRRSSRRTQILRERADQEDMAQSRRPRADLWRKGRRHEKDRQARQEGLPACSRSVRLRQCRRHVPGR